MNLVRAAWAAAALGAVGCGSARRSAPLMADASPQDSLQAAGHVVFDRNCGSCHPGGAGGLGPAINNKPLPGFVIRYQVRNGHGAMPAFGEDRISDEQLDAVVSYLQWLRDRSPRADETNGS